jgi:hypothetical protein
MSAIFPFLLALFFVSRVRVLATFDAEKERGTASNGAA